MVAQNREQDAGFLSAVKEAGLEHLLPSYETELLTAFKQAKTFAAGLDRGLNIDDEPAMTLPVTHDD